MKLSFKELGSYIEEITIINTNLNVSHLRGISSIYKNFIKSKANIVGVDFLDYKIVSNNQFAFNPNTARMGDKIPIALNESEDCIVSKIYPVFKIKNTNELLPEYLMMWFRRSEFDRYARFMSHGSAREVFDWEEMCNVSLPIPSIEKQKEIVKEYDVIQERINLNEKLIKKLEETAQTIYKQWFIDFEFPNEDGNPYKNSGGEMAVTELGEIPVGWQVKSFTSVLNLSGGGTPSTSNDEYWNGSIPFFTPTDDENSYYSIKTEKYITKSGLENSSSKIYPKNTIFITARGTVGGVSLAGTEMAMNQSCYAVLGTRTINQFFAHQLTLNIIPKLKNEALGAVFSALVTKNFDSQKVIMPNEKLIHRYGGLVNPIYKLILIKTIQNKIFSELKDVILSKISSISN